MLMKMSPIDTDGLREIIARAASNGYNRSQARAEIERLAMILICWNETEGYTDTSSVSALLEEVKYLRDVVKLVHKMTSHGI